MAIAKTPLVFLSTVVILMVWALRDGLTTRVASSVDSVDVIVFKNKTLSSAEESAVPRPNSKIDKVPPPPLSSSKYGPDDWRSRVRFFVLGAQKGGSTTLYRYMKQHPHILRGMRKELRCFGTRWDPNDPYCAKFMEGPARMLIGNLTNTTAQVLGDYSPGYLWHSEKAAPLIQDAYPEARFVAVLRQPIRRAYSQYQMNKRNGKRDDQTFEQVVHADLELLRICGMLPHWDFDGKNKKRKLTKVETFSLEEYASATVRPHKFNKWFGTQQMKKAWQCTFDHPGIGSTLNQGLYAVSLYRWFQQFPREQFLILKSEDMQQHPQQIVDRVFEHIRLQPLQLNDTSSASNVGTYSALETESETIGVLRKLYRQYTDQLRIILQQDDPSWSTVWEDDELS